MAFDFEDEEILATKEEELLAELKDRSMFEAWDMVLPKYKPRTSQKDVMEWINDLPPEIKYIMVEMPVGGGKSPLAIAFSSYINNGLGSSFILTPQKTLQRQYEQSFENHILASVYGRSNYTCEPKNTNCDVGGDIKPRCDNCPANIARDIAIQSPNMVLNYAIALTYFKYLSHKIPARDVMIFDECHTLESHLVEFGSIDITEKKCKNYGVMFKKPKDTDAALDWIRDVYIKAVETTVYKLRQQIKAMDDRPDMKLSKEDVKLIKNYKSSVDHLEALVTLLSLDRGLIDKKYVLMTDKNYFKFKELFGKSIFKHLVLPKANRFLFLSSTILNKDEFCKDLGIDPKEAAFISVDSEFNVENREVIYKPVTKMNYGWDSAERIGERKHMVKVINHILDHHSDQSGIIHSGSFQIAEWLLRDIKTTHEVIHHNPTSDMTRDEVIDYYLENSEKRPILLISPSVTEGMDLLGDKGRFAIIAKVPYPFLGDAWVKRRMQLSKDWYNRQTITGIIQGCGRVVRSKDDWGQVYILDESFAYLYKQTVKIIPQWWKDGLVVM